MTEPAQETIRHSRRRTDIDALRILAVLALLLYHSARPFDLEPWHVKNEALSAPLHQLGGLLTPWRLPLLFMLSGAGTFYALGTRSPARYALERLGRLGVPLAFGMAVVIPPQVYVERISRGMPGRLSPIDFEGTYLEFYGRYFSTGAYPHGDLSWHHLWFLAYLLVFSLAALPLFLWLRSGRGRESTGRLAAFLATGWRIALPLGLLLVIHVALRGRYPSTHALVGDWWNLTHYAVLFLLGYLLLPEPRVMDALARHRRLALALFALAAAARLVAIGAVGMTPPYSAPYALLMALRACTEWFGLMAVLGFAQGHLRRPSRFVRWAAPRVYPFYVWHQTVIVVVAFFAIRWAAGPIAKFGIVALVSLAASVALVELVSRTPLTRALFGMRAR